MAAPHMNPQANLQPVHQSRISQEQVDGVRTIPGIANPENSRIWQQLQDLQDSRRVQWRRMGGDGVAGGEPNTQLIELLRSRGLVPQRPPGLVDMPGQMDAISPYDAQSHQFPNNTANTLTNNLDDGLPNTARLPTNRNTSVFAAGSEQRQLELLRQQGASYQQLHLPQQFLQRQLQPGNVWRPTPNDLQEKLKTVQAALHDNERQQSELYIACQNGDIPEVEYLHKMDMLKRDANNKRGMMEWLSIAIAVLQQNPIAYGGIQTPDPGRTSPTSMSPLPQPQLPNTQNPQGQHNWMKPEDQEIILNRSPRVPRGTVTPHALTPATGSLPLVKKEEEEEVSL